MTTPKDVLAPTPLDFEILNEFYRVAEDVLADSTFAPGDYYAEDLQTRSRLLKHYKSSGGGERYAISCREARAWSEKDSLRRALVDACKTNNGIGWREITVSVGTFSCTFLGTQIFDYVAIWEKMCKVTGNKRKCFHIPDDDEFNAANEIDTTPVAVEPQTNYEKHADLKKKHPDAVVLIPCGDFYETYGDDARKVHDVVGVLLTKRKNGVVLAGFPKRNLGLYLPKLAAAGRVVVFNDETKLSQTYGVAAA